MNIYISMTRLDNLEYLQGLLPELMTSLRVATSVERQIVLIGDEGFTDSGTKQWKKHRRTAVPKALVGTPSSNAEHTIYDLHNLHKEFT